MSQFIEMFTNNDFEMVPLGDLCDKISDGSHNPPKGIENSKYLMISSKNVFKDHLDLTDVRYLTEDDFEVENKRTNVKANDVLLTIVGTIGRTYLVKGDEGNLVMQRSVAVLTPNSRVTPLFLMFYLHSDKNLEKEGRGNAQKGIYLKQLSQYEIKVPSIDLQKQFEAIYLQADKSEFDGIKSQFIEMFGHTENTKPLSDFIEVSFPGEWGQEDKDGNGVKVIRTTNFTNTGKLNLADVVTRDIDPNKVEKKKLKKGDIILERSGGTNDNPVGRVAYFNEDGLYLFNNFTQLLRCKEEVNSLFIFYSLFNYYQMNKRIIRSMGNKTTGIQNLKMDQYWQIPIADVSVERQNEFEAIYNQADKSEYGLDILIKAVC